MKHTSYVYLERGSDDEEDPMCDLVPIVGEENFWAIERSMVGLPEEWQEQLSKLRPGYYRMTCESHAESESWEMPQEYEVLSWDVLPEMVPAPIAGRLIDWREAVYYWVEWFFDLFRRCWSVEEDDGCIGHGRYRMHLWKALGVRLTWWMDHNKDHRWWAKDQRHLITVRIRKSHF